MIEIHSYFTGTLYSPLQLIFTLTWLDEDEAWPIREALYAQIMGWA